MWSLLDHTVSICQKSHIFVTNRQLVMPEETSIRPCPRDPLLLTTVIVGSRREDEWAARSMMSTYRKYIKSLPKGPRQWAREATGHKAGRWARPACEPCNKCNKFPGTQRKNVTRISNALAGTRSSVSGLLCSCRAWVHALFSLTLLFAATFWSCRRSCLCWLWNTFVTWPGKCMSSMPTRRWAFVLIAPLLSSFFGLVSWLFERFCECRVPTFWAHTRFAPISYINYEAAIKGWLPGHCVHLQIGK